MENTQHIPPLTLQPDSSVPAFKQKSCIAMSTVVITAIFSAMLCSALIFFWYRSVSSQAHHLLERYIDDMRLQRDEVLDQRADLKKAYDKALLELKELKGEDGVVKGEL